MPNIVYFETFPIIQEAYEFDFVLQKTKSLLFAKIVKPQTSPSICLVWEPTAVAENGDKTYKYINLRPGTVELTVFYTIFN
jgi:hypothetical protein